METLGAETKPKVVICQCAAGDIAIGHMTYCPEGAISLASHIVDPEKARACARQHVREVGGNRCTGCYCRMVWPCTEALVCNYTLGKTLL